MNNLICELIITMKKSVYIKRVFAIIMVVTLLLNGQDLFCLNSSLLVSRDCARAATDYKISNPRLKDGVTLAPDPKGAIELKDSVDAEDKVTYNVNTGALEARDINSFKVKLPEAVPVDSEVEITIKGKLNGELGFRACLYENSDIVASEFVEYETTGDFLWNITLANNKGVSVAPYILFKGISYDKNIDSLDVISIVVSDLKVTPTSEVIPTATPIQTPVLIANVTKSPIMDNEENDNVSSVTQGKSKRKVVINVPNSIKKAYGTKNFKLLPSITGDGKVTYKSSNKKIVKIDKNGLVTITGYGKAKITINVASTREYNAGKKTVTIIVVPERVKGFIAKSNSVGRINFSWRKTNNKNAKIMIEASTSPQFTNIKRLPAKELKKSKLSNIKGLKRGRIWYFRARIMIKTSGKTYYSDWVNKKIKVK